MNYKRFCLLLHVVGVALLLAPVIGFAAQPATTMVSVDANGVQGDGYSYFPSISADGRYVAFNSVAGNLVTGDSNAANDVFVRDRQAGVITRVSVDSIGVEGNGVSREPSISSDGRYVAFYSAASNLVANDSNAANDVFVRDRQTGETTRVSVDSSGVEGNGVSLNASISADGRYVAFDSAASNLVSGDTNGKTDVFVHDHQTGETTRVSVDSSGVQGNGGSYTPSISADGRYVAFYSDSSNLITGDTNAKGDVFVHDRQTGTTTMVSVDSSGVQGNGNSEYPSISADGRYVAFRADSSNLVTNDTNAISDIFVHDCQSGATIRASVDSSGVQGNGYSDVPSISADGRYVAFASEASNLVSNDTNSTTDVFVRGPLVSFPWPMFLPAIIK
jgi:Tol biopolymer transport system component